MPRLLSEDQKAAIDQVIEDHRLAFLAEVLGPDAIPKADYDRLRRAGKVKDPPFPVDAATAAHVLGALAGESGDEEAVVKLSASAFLEAVEDRADSLTPVEREAIDVAKDRVAGYVKGIGDRLAANFNRIIVESDDKARRQKQLAVQREAQRGLHDRETMGQIAERFKTATGDALRDWMKVAQTEVHNCTDEGRAAQILKTAPHGSDPLVYKRPRPDACVFCRLLYTVDGVVPRVFHLSELVANGTNIDRRARRPTLKGPNATEWRAVLGATHPWCACSLFHMPAGFAFDKEGKLRYVGLEKALVQVDHLDPALLRHECLDH